MNFMRMMDQESAGLHFRWGAPDRPGCDRPQTHGHIGFTPWDRHKQPPYNLIFINAHRLFCLPFEP